MSKHAVFLDRDGTIFEDTRYPGDTSPIRLLTGSSEALRRLQKYFLLIIISNQSGVGRGIITHDEMLRVHDKMKEVLTGENITITDVYYCPHAPSDHCYCRKPKPEMILSAAEKWDIDLAGSYMIGDKWSDAEAGYRAGCKSILLQKAGSSHFKQKRKPYPDLITLDLQNATKWILNDMSKINS